MILKTGTKFIDKNELIPLQTQFCCLKSIAHILGAIALCYHGIAMDVLCHLNKWNDWCWVTMYREVTPDHSCLVNTTVRHMHFSSYCTLGTAIYLVNDVWDLVNIIP